MTYGFSTGKSGLVVCVLILAAMGLAISAPVAAQQAAPRAPAAASDDPVVARVNGQPILRSEIMMAAESLPPQLRAVPVEALFPALLNQVIDRKLTVAQAQKEKFDKEPQIVKRLSEIHERVLEQLYLTNKIDKELSDEVLKAEYDKMPSEKRVRASHILVKTRDEAVQIIRDIGSGQKFEDLAAKRSLDPSGRQGGDLGFFSKEQMVPSFADASFTMKKGEISRAPVQTEFGWHIIRVDDTEENAKPAFEEKRDELRDRLSDEYLGKQVDRLRDTAKIERFTIDGLPEPTGGQQLGR